MSIWREIWKESVAANSLMFFNKDAGLIQFNKLLEKYKKDGKYDGMIFYARAEAYELIGEKENAKKDFQEAKKLFPVEHWQKVAEKSYQRIHSNVDTEQAYNQNDFFDYLNYVFQKIYEFVYLDDFVRYVCLSAVSRASSEWPLSLIDFRTVLELQVNALLIRNKRNIPDLCYAIDNLKAYKIVEDESIISKMHRVRENGNEATHDIKNIKVINDLSSKDLKDELKKVKCFYSVLEFFNTYNKEYNIKSI